MALIEVSSDSEQWLQLKHLIRAAGYRYNLQQNLFDSNRLTLFLEQMPEPEHGKLTHGLLVYDGGCSKSGHFAVDSKVFEQYSKEIGVSQ
jgi:hypothetical protein